MADDGAPLLQLEWLKVACTIQPLVSVLVATISATALATFRSDDKPLAAVKLHVANLHATSFFCAIFSVLVANQAALLPCICLQLFRACTPERVKQVVCYALWLAGALLVCSLCTLSFAIMATAGLPLIGAAICSAVWGLLSASSIMLLLFVDKSNSFFWHFEPIKDYCRSWCLWRARRYTSGTCERVIDCKADTGQWEMGCHRR